MEHNRLLRERANGPAGSNQLAESRPGDVGLSSLRFEESVDFGVDAPGRERLACSEEAVPPYLAGSKVCRSRRAQLGPVREMNLYPHPS